MRIHTVKKGIRSNHTIRWGGYNNEGTKRNGIIYGAQFVDRCGVLNNIGYDSKIKHKLLKKYAKYLPQQITSNCDDYDDYDDYDDCYDDYDAYITRVGKNCAIKFKSHVHCCQMCGGSRFNCKAIFNETNQYGKGVYRTKKYVVNPMNDYYDYLASYDDHY